MNVWVDIARGCAAADPTWLSLRARLMEAVEDEKVVVPLSAAHYLELWHRREAASRHTVAELMRDVTRYAAIAPPHAIRTLEAEALVDTWESGRSSVVARADVFGHGATHAFGRPEGRFRFVESIASLDGNVPEGPPMKPPEGWDKFVVHPMWEWFQLSGIEGLFELGEGFDRTPEHRVGSSELKLELEFREWLRGHPERRQRLQETVVLHEYESMREVVEPISRVRRVHVPEQLRPGYPGSDSMEQVRALVRACPASDVWATLRYLKHRDLNLPWEQHDWTDLWTLSVVIPYCDVVITEKRWAHLASVGGLTTRYGTSVSSGKQAISRELDRIEG